MFNKLGRFAGPGRRDEHDRRSAACATIRLWQIEMALAATAHQLDAGRDRRRRGQHHLAHLLGDREHSRRAPPPTCTPPASSTARSDLPRSTASTSRWRSRPCCCCWPSCCWAGAARPSPISACSPPRQRRRCSPTPSSAACCRTRMTAMARAWSGSRRSSSRCCCAGCMPGAACRRPASRIAGPLAAEPDRRPAIEPASALLFPPQRQCYKSALAPGSTCVLIALRLCPPSSRPSALCRLRRPRRRATGRARPRARRGAATDDPASPSNGRSRTASGCSAARPTSSAMSIANRAGSQLAAEHHARARHRRPRLGAEPGRPSLRQRRRRAAGHLRPRRRARKLSGAEDPSGRRAADRRGAARRDLQLELRRRHHPAEAGQRALRAAGAAAPRLRQADHRRRRHHAARQQRRQRLDRDRGARSADRGTGRLGRRRRRQSRPADRARRRGLLLPALPRRGARRIFPAEPARLQGRQGLRRQPRRLRRLHQPTGTATARAGCRRPATARCTAISFAPRSRSRSRTRRSPSPSCRSPAAARRSRAACSARRAPATARRRGRCAGTVPPQIEQLQDMLDKARKQIAEPQARPRAAHGRRQRHQVLRPRRRRHHQRRRRAHAVQPGRPARDGAAGAGPPRPRACPATSPSSAPR